MFELINILMLHQS